MRLPIYFLLLVIIITATRTQKDCDNDAHSQKLQLMFLIDQTSSYEKYFQKISSTLEQVMEDVNEIHPGSQFGVALFGNYPGETCYQLVQPLTRRLESVTESFAKLNASGGPDHENPMAGVAFAATDTTVGWDDPETTQTKETRRFIVLMTDTANKYTELDSSRHAFVGDGTDTCVTTYYPAWPQTRSALSRWEINVVGFYSNKNVMDELEDSFWITGVPYCAGHFQDDARKYISAFQETVSKCVRSTLRCVRDN